MPPKITKETAKYVPDSKNQSHCAICRMFRAPNECTLVKGDIDPQGWCKFWEKR